MNMNEDFFGTTQLVKDRSYSELFLVFSLSDKTYAIAAEKVLEIIQLPALTVVEKFPDYIAGLLNMRGHVISVIDPAKMLGISRKEYTIDYQVLIVECKNKTFGIIVDSVSEVVQLNRRNLEPLPYKPREKIISGIYKHEGRLIAFFDLNSVVENIEIIDADAAETDEKSYAISEYFPSDESSRLKLLKRAEKLRQEIVSPADNLNYQENYFLSFALNNEIFCINLKYVKEITKLNLVNLRLVPCVPEFICGIINLRGEFITIVDIKYFLQITRTPVSDKTKIIVVSISDIQIGILVEEVFGIENISTEKININTQNKYDKMKYTSAEVMLPNNKVMSVFDLRKLIEDERLYIEDSV